MYKRLAFLAICILGLGGYAAFASRSDPAPKSPLHTVSRAPIETTTSAFGRLNPAAIAHVSQMVAGRIQGLPLRVGDKVAIGDTVATLDARLHRLTIDALTLDIARMDAMVRERETETDLRAFDVKRTQDLRSSGVASETALQQHRAAYKTAIARLDQARAQRDKLQTDLAYQEALLDMMTIKSPIQGRVLEMNAREGAYIDPAHPGNRLMTIAQTDQLILEAMVSEADVLRLAPDTQARITLVSDPGFNVTSTITRIRPKPVEVNGATLYIVEIPILNPDNRLRVGMTARADFITESRENVLVVPSSAIGHQGTASFVARPNGEKIALHPVQTGLRTRSHHEILGGLEEGDHILTTFPEAAIQ